MVFNRDRSFNNRGRFDKPTMHQAVCDKCRKECEVPFRPTSGKPVYCSNCFDRPTSPRRPEGRDFQRPNYEERRTPDYGQQFAALNAKLDKILNILESIAQETETPKETASEE